MIVGLTGGIGSGKTTVLSLFEKKQNVVTYIADAKAKWLMQNATEVKNKLIQAFGQESYKDNTLNREYLSQIVFYNPEKLKELNSIIHPAVKKDFEEFAALNRDKIIIYEAAILFEHNSENRFNFIISVSSNKNDRVNRVIKRDNIQKGEVISRIKNQLSDTQRNLQSHYIIFNNSIEELESKVDEIYNILTKKADFV